MENEGGGEESQEGDGYRDAVLLAHPGYPVCRQDRNRLAAAFDSLVEDDKQSG